MKQDYSLAPKSEIDSTEFETVADVVPLYPNSSQLNETFAELERSLPFVEDESWGNLLRFTDNLTAPLHRWFLFKEGYSYKLVDKILDRFDLPGKSSAILDPFSGSGTTLLAAQKRGIPSVGLEINPFAAFLGRIKTQWYRIEPEILEKELSLVLQDNEHPPANLPALSTLHNNKYFPNGHADELLKLRNAILRRPCSQETKDFLLLALLASIEDVSYLHKDGRLLRFFQRDIIPPKEALSNRTKIIIEDLENLIQQDENGTQNPCIPQTNVIQGDARDLDSVLDQHEISDQFGLILYSPPYPNNFDYSEIYKCELWLGGFLNSYEEWRNLRLRTFRSHPSCSFPETHCLKDNVALREVYQLVEKMAKCPDIGEPGSRARVRAPKVIRGYFDDVYLMLEQQKIRLKTSGYIICVVGNSRHGNLHVRADTIIAKIGQAIGLELVEIRVARHRQSRSQQVQKLRESLVVFQKNN
ncbi:site-specific DNA-methyltransferase [Laspinema olomoucense]|uniref:Site-specific DNA-methyltransferase n=1 Tax=Laspinema olomoucense D3b TaxID=2953688 RepID=A0ABT2NBI6_9CYAN|nr:site-specific DNA-methyltransferase [Laspinema sp. D3b]MCT7980059.1 site-specific DNA-methyltransferase [Laspinema sp. D3b]